VGVRVAFVGKGGAGKTTLAVLFSRFLVASGCRVLAVDADINQNLAGALGEGEDVLRPALGGCLPQIKEYLRGDNPRIFLGRGDGEDDTPGSGVAVVDYRRTHADPPAVHPYR
jgi:CO dehydrogenase maturation factor